MCSLGSGSDTGVGTRAKLAIGGGTTLGGGAIGAAAAGGGVRSTLLGGASRQTGSGNNNVSPTGYGSGQRNPRQMVN